MKRDLLVIAGLFALSVGLLWYTAHNSKNNSTTTRAKQTQRLVIGVNAEYPPFAFVRNNQVIGLDIDLAHAIAKELKQELEIKNMSFSALLPELQLGSVDIIASGVTPSPERAKRVLFSTPYLTGDQLVIVAPTTTSIASIDDLLDKRVVVNEGFSADRYMSSLNGPELIRLETVHQAFMELNNKNVDAFVSALSPLQGYFEKFGQKAYNVIPIESTEETYALGISKKRPELLNRINLALEKIKTDGTLEDIIKKWMSTEAA